MGLRRVYWLLLLVVVTTGIFYSIGTSAINASNLFQRREPVDVLSPGLIKSSWGKKLNPSGAIPNAGFKAFYFNRDAPGYVVHSENVESIAINYSWAEFHNIDSPKFGGYWVGRLNFSEATQRQIGISQSWAKSRIFIDGEIVYDGGAKTSFTHLFSAGEHVIEVEYINNWHTTEFKVTFGEAVEEMGEAEVADFFAGTPPRAAKLYHVGVYESDAKDTSIDLSIPRTGAPIVLWLTSYEGVDWKIASSDKIATIVLNSFSPGSRVSGASGARILHLKGWVSGSYKETKSCSCGGGHWHCESESDLGQIADRLKRITGLRLSGYAGQYGATSLVIRSYDQPVIARIEQAREAITAAERICRNRADPDFDSMMN